jgi:hypothetical protein
VNSNIHALSGIRTHDPNNKAAITHALDRAATVTTRHNIKEDSHLDTRRRQNFRSHQIIFGWFASYLPTQYFLPPDESRILPQNICHNSCHIAVHIVAPKVKSCENAKM